MKQTLKDQLLKFFPVPEELWQELEPVLLERDFPRGATILQPGQVADRLYFVLKGAFRSYLLREGEDITDYFFFEHSLATDFASYYAQQPAVFYLEALENSATLQIKRADFLNLTQKHPFFETVARVIAETAFVEIEERMRLLHHENLETRYRWMMQKFPQVFQRVPQYHIASYLGVKPESLSRIKKTIGKGL